MADATDNFDSYSDGSSLASAPNWTVDAGSFVIINPTGTAGLVRGNSSGAISAARYTGETFDSDQYAECVLDFVSAIAGNAHGVAVRRQASADSMYFLYLDSNQPWYFGVRIAGSDTYPLSGSISPVTTGTKLRLEVAGAGSATRLNAYYDNGGGWVQIITNYDPGAGNYLDGGSPGLAVYSDLNVIRIDSWLGGPIAAAGSNSDASASFTLGAISLSATGYQPQEAAASFTLGAIALSSDATQGAKANVSFSLGPITLGAAGSQPGPSNPDADASFTLGAISLSATAYAGEFNAVASFSLGPINLVSTAINAQNADADVVFTLGAISLTATAAIELKPSTHTETEIHEAVCAWLTSQTGLPVIRDHQSGTRPPLVYLMAELVMVRATHEHPQNFQWYDLASINIAGKRDKFGVPIIEREWDFMVFAYGEDGPTRLRELQARVQFSQINENITTTAMIHSMTDIALVPEEIEHGWERRAYCNLRIRAMEPDGAIVDVIEEATAEHTVLK